ncbi:MAG TPA: hypothetical protein VNS63_01235 [Blastocatellia bacterium]|nr:hypothetical protein [Blastocatellia bacterium]
MRSREFAQLIILLLATLVAASCNKPTSATNEKPATPINSNASPPAASPTQSEVSPKSAGSAPEKGTAAAPKLHGAYVMSEIHDKGVVNLISEFKTVIYFSADGTYSRASSKKGTVYHTDSGQYRVDGDDKLVLTIQMSKGVGRTKAMENQIHNPPLQKTHKFTLSAGGEELRMTSDDGKVALFRRSDTLSK